MAIFPEVSENEFVRETHPLSKAIILDQYCAITGKRYELGCKVLLFTKRKLHWYEINDVNGVMTADPRCLCDSGAFCFYRNKRAICSATLSF